MHYRGAFRIYLCAVPGCAVGAAIVLVIGRVGVEGHVHLDAQDAVAVAIGAQGVIVDLVVNDGAAAPPVAAVALNNHDVAQEGVVDGEGEAVATVAAFGGDVRGVDKGVLREQLAPGAHVFVAGRDGADARVVAASDCQVDVVDAVAAAGGGDGGGYQAALSPHEAVAPDIDAFGRRFHSVSDDAVGVDGEVEDVDGVMVGGRVVDHDHGVVVIGFAGDVPSEGGASHFLDGLDDRCCINLSEYWRASDSQKQTE